MWDYPEVFKFLLIYIWEIKSMFKVLSINKTKLQKADSSKFQDMTCYPLISRSQLQFSVDHSTISAI